GQHGPWQYFAMAYVEGVALSLLVSSTRQRAASHHDGRTPSLAELVGESLRPGPEAGGRPLTTCADTVPAAGPTPDGGPAEHGAARVAPRNLDPARRLLLSPDYFRSVAGVMADAAVALHHAHNAGVLHRDVKPGNILVDKLGRCCLIDFGLARSLGQEGEAGCAADPHPADGQTALTKGLIGTPQYMAPEQFREQADARSDGWGVGVTLYELLALRRAFDGPSVAEIERRVTTEEPRPLEQLVGNIPADLKAICRKAMKKNAGQRYATGQELADDLRRWLG